MRLNKIIRIPLPRNRLLAFKLFMWYEKMNVHYGVTNEVPSGGYIPFWDFREDIPLDILQEEMIDVQERHKLSNIYFLQTTPKQSFRAFSLDVMSFNRYISILSDTNWIDQSYLKHTVMRGRAVIRITEKDGTKNKLVSVLYDDKHNLLSNHHASFF